ncbi:MAG TPA: hypothetical protein DCY00_06790 [Actinobacteria bacterium]|nr:hypothetical protein [Actinomycetota bacterium]
MMKDYLKAGLFYLELLEKNNIQDKKDKHPEISVFNHSLQVFYLLSKRTNDIDLMIAGLFHDIGKNISTIDHDKIGHELLRDFYPEKVAWLIKNHIRIIYYHNGEMKKKKRDELESHPYFGLLKILRECDSEGRKPDFPINYDVKEIISILEKAIEKRFNYKIIKG